MIGKVVSVLAAAVLAGCSLYERSRDDATKVLMIGNSFSISVMSHLPAVAKECGLKIDIASAYIGGCSLKRHMENVAKDGQKDFRPYKITRFSDGRTTNSRMNVTDALRLEKWDIVTVQQASGYSWREQSYHPHGDRLVAKIRELSPTAEIWVQETWSYTPWDARLKAWGIDQNEMYRKLHAAYASFARKHSLKVIPMGTAIQSWRRELPVVYTENSLGGDVVGGGKLDERDHFRRKPDNTWKIYCDTFHLGRKGEYFQALVWAKTLFNADLSKIRSFPEGISHSEGELMKKIASETIFSAE